MNLLHSIEEEMYLLCTYSVPISNLKRMQFVLPQKYT